jgi:hypothetical protein
MAFAGVLALQDLVWLKSPDEGKKESGRTGKPVLLVTLDGPGG